MTETLTIRQLAERYGEDKKVDIICQDEDTVVLTMYVSKADNTEQEYSFEVGM
ncbi:MAG: hypothetical protein ACLRQ0_10690 [Monoglobales bacterium]